MSGTFALETPDARAAVLVLAANLLASMAGAWFGVNALYLYRHHSSEFENSIWQHFVVSSVALVVHGVLRVWALLVPRYSTAGDALADLVFVVFLFFLAFGIRRLFHETSLPVPYVEFVSRATLGRIERGLLVVIVAGGVAVLLLGSTVVVQVLFGVSGTLVALYGTVIGVNERSMVAMRGTAISSLLGYLVPAIGCAGLVPVLALTQFGSGHPFVHADLQRLVLVVVAAFLLMATVQLHDLVESLG